MAELEIFKSLGIALALGLLIGLERGWSDRNEEEGRRIAGMRTYGLIGLLGGIIAHLADPQNDWLIGLAFLGLSLVLAIAYIMRLRLKNDLGITSIVAALLTFTLGAIAMKGHIFVAVSVAIVTSLLLGIKPQLHDWINRLEKVELHATLKLLLISIVVTHLLPDQGYGPWNKINPFEIWWMVVLIAAISYLGYFAIKIGGAQYGILATGIFGGLASSTAVTLTLSRLADRQKDLSNILAAGILAACGTMFPRVLIVTGIINSTIAERLLLPFLVMTALIYAAAIYLWFRGKKKTVGNEGLLIKNPFQLSMALQFGVLLTIIMLLSKFLQVYFGNAGIYLLSALSGLTDVDAITLSMSRMNDTEITLKVASLAILIAAISNTLVKAGLSAGIGRNALGYKVALPLLLSLGSGIGVFFLL